jgi:protein TonB
MISKQHWFAAMAVATSLHVAAFMSLPLAEEANTSKDKGEAGIEVDLGMLGDLGVAMVETVEEKVEQLEPEPLKDEPVTDAEPVSQPKPEPIIKPIEVDKKTVVQKDTVKLKQQRPQSQKVSKDTKKVQLKETVKTEIKNKPKQVAESKTSTPAKQSNVEAKKITTGSQNTISTGGNKGADRSYIAVISAKLARYKRYPNRARKQQQEGTVTLFFIVKRNGKVIESSISESSGYPLLDKAVLRMLKKASPLPPFPQDMEQSQLSIRIPIEFKLNDKR